MKIIVMTPAIRAKRLRRLSNASLVKEFDAAWESGARGEAAEARIDIIYEEMSRRYTACTMFDDDWKI